MSEQTNVSQTPANAQSPVYVVYDPARRRSRRAKQKPAHVGPRGGRAWIGPSALRYDPALVAYEPRRRRRVKYDPVIGGGKQITDALVDGFGFGLLTHHIPIPSGSVGGFSYADVAAGVLTFVYERFYMRRGWTAALLGAVAGLATGKISSSLGGWRP